MNVRTLGQERSLLFLSPTSFPCSLQGALLLSDDLPWPPRSAKCTFTGKFKSHATVTDRVPVIFNQANQVNWIWSQKRGLTAVALFITAISEFNPVQVTAVYMSPFVFCFGMTEPFTVTGKGIMRWSMMHDGFRVKLMLASDRVPDYWPVKKIKAREFNKKAWNFYAKKHVTHICSLCSLPKKTRRTDLIKVFRYCCNWE